jgi:hypothetical protein
MKQKRLFVPPLGARGLLYTAAVLLMSVSCNKEEPNLDCDDGTCCGSVQAGRFKFIQQVENAPADFWSQGGGGFYFNPNISITPTSSSISVCEISAEKVKNLKHTSTFGTNLPAPYKYRVWGKIYQVLDARVIIDIPVYMINVEKVEEVK